MKNKEKYAKEIAEIACESSSFGIDKHAGVIYVMSFITLQ